jgi:hypothetical protein
VRNQREVLGAALLSVFTAGWLAVQGVQAQLPGALPGVEPLHDSGQDVTPAFEGWFKNADGTVDILFGYNNRNQKQELDIPIGPNNKIEPGNPDQGQPTHFDNKNKSRNYKGPAVTVTWTKYRGPGTVTFAKNKPLVDNESHHATTTATFSEPGDYWLRVVANDSSGDGGGGFQCCWTNGIVKVSVKSGNTR